MATKGSPSVSTKEEDQKMSTLANLYMDERGPLINQIERKNPLGKYKWRIYLSEFIGTFIFVFLTVTSDVSSQKHSTELNLSPILVAAFANGLAIIAVVYSLGSVSGAHINPAVTLGALVARKLSALEAAGYIFSQILGSTVASACVLIAHQDATSHENGNLGVFLLPGGIDWNRAFFVEVVLTFVLVFVIFCVVLNPHPTLEDLKNDHISPLFAPIAIGFAVAANIFAGGYISGACMNPARALGPILITGIWQHSYIYLIAPPIGGVLAATFQWVLFGKNSVV